LIGFEIDEKRFSSFTSYARHATYRRKTKVILRNFTTYSGLIKICRIIFNSFYFNNKKKVAGKGYLARKNAKFRPKAIGILQEKAIQYLAWREVRQEQIKVKSK